MSYCTAYIQYVTTDATVSARWKSYRPHVVSSRSWQSRRANKHNARDPPPKTRCLRLHPVALPFPDGLDPSCSCKPSDAWKISFPRSLLPDHTTPHYPAILLLYLSSVLLSTIQEARLDHVQNPATQTPEYHAAQEQGPTELGGSSGGRASFWFCGHGADHPLQGPAPSPAHCMQGLVLSRHVPSCAGTPPKMVKRRSVPLKDLLLSPPALLPGRMISVARTAEREGLQK